MITHLEVAFVIVAVTASLTETCMIGKHLRGDWLIVDSNGVPIKSEYIKVSRHNVDIFKDGKKIAYVCSHTKGNLMQLQPDSGEGYICLDFVPISDGNAEYTVIRRVHHATSRISDISPTGISQCSRSGDLGSVQIKREDPGCTFPSKLQGDWSFSDNFIKTLSIIPNTLTIEAYDHNTMKFFCERFQMDGNNTYMFALRKAELTTDKDGCLCLRFKIIPLTGRADHKYILTGQRFNAGTPIKLLSREEPIYLHQTCDFVDSMGTDTWDVAVRKT